MTKFVDDNILDIWWDKNMTAGYDFWEQIDFHIENINNRNICVYF